MTSTYSPKLRLNLMGNGDQSGTWGSTNNINLGTLLEQSIAGIASVNIGGEISYTLTSYNGVADEARAAVILLSGAIPASCDVICPSGSNFSKIYYVYNGTTGGFPVVFKTSGGSGVTIPSGSRMVVYCDGVNVSSGINDLPGSSSVGGIPIVTTTGTQTLTNKTLTAPKFADLGFIADTNGNEMMIFDGVTSAVNELTLANSATGNGPILAATGGDTNIDLNLVSKGTGLVKANAVEVATISTAQTLTNKTLTAPKFADLGFIADANGNELVVFDSAASAVNEITLTNAAAAGTPTISATGSDTDINLNLVSKGAGIVQINGAAVASAADLTAIPELAKSATYTLALADAGKMVTFSGGSAQILYVPAAGTADFANGTRIDIAQIGTGSVTVAPAGGSGVTISSYGGDLLLSGQYAGATLWKKSDTQWYLFGNLTS